MTEDEFVTQHGLNKNMLKRGGGTATGTTTLVGATADSAAQPELSEAWTPSSSKTGGYLLLLLLLPLQPLPTTTVTMGWFQRGYSLSQDF